MVLPPGCREDDLGLLGAEVAASRNLMFILTDNILDSYWWGNRQGRGWMGLIGLQLCCTCGVCREGDRVGTE